MIPNIPQSKIDKLMKYADTIDNWIPLDTEKKLGKRHIITHHGIEIRYVVIIKNDPDDNTIGELPERCLTFKIDETNKEINEFMNRTLKAFGFTSPDKQIGKGTIHYCERLFDI